MADLQSNKEETLYYLRLVKRPGMDKLINFLETSDFFTAPASTKWHGSFPGGLNLHSLNVYKMFAPRNRKLENPLPFDSEIIVSFGHDLCKIGYYYFEDGEWHHKKEHPANKLHGILSVQMLEEYIELTEEERDVITYHMGLFGVFGTVVEYKGLQMYAAIAKCVAVQCFASCDNEEAHSKT